MSKEQTMKMANECFWGNFLFLYRIGNKHIPCLGPIKMLK